MKKTLLVIAVAAVLVFAFAGPALAVNASQQMRLGAPADASANVGQLAPGQTNPVAGAGTNTYEDWQPALLGNADAVAGNSPHGNYTTSTVKCVVCHAVHYAAPGGAPVSASDALNAADPRIGTQAADTLLRVRAESACIYCHATADQAVNGRPVYNGEGALISGPTDDTYGHRVGTNCNTCHASVHGVGADNSVAALKGYLLLKMTNTIEGGAVTNNMLDSITAIDNRAMSQGFASGKALGGTPADYFATNTLTMREQAVGVFCAECHNGAYATVAAGASTNVRGATASAMFSGHRIAATDSTTWNATGNISTGSQRNIAVAWAPATNCKSCHDATDLGGTAFPHSWGSTPTKMWLTNGPNAGSKTAVTGDGVQLEDGVCLKCHVNSDGTQGVGLTF